MAFRSFNSIRVDGFRSDGEATSRWRNGRSARHAASALTLALLLLCSAACRDGCSSERRVEDAKVETWEDDDEDRDRNRDHYWRAAVVIKGEGSVRTFIDGIRCERDGTQQRGDCGPTLFKTKELAPPTMEATGASGWRFSHWEAAIVSREGAVARKTLADAKSRLYVSGFGYADTGELEMLTAVFARTANAEQGDAPSRELR